MTEPDDKYLNLIWEIGELRHEVQALRAEVDRLDDWQNGVFSALLDLTQMLTSDQPELKARLLSRWKDASEKFDRLEQNPGQHDDFQETAELLEARKMLYRILGTKAEPSPPPLDET